MTTTEVDDRGARRKKKGPNAPRNDGGRNESRETRRSRRRGGRGGGFDSRWRRARGARRRRRRRRRARRADERATVAAARRGDALGNVASETAAHGFRDADRNCTRPRSGILTYTRRRQTGRSRPLFSFCQLSFPARSSRRSPHRHRAMSAAPFRRAPLASRPALASTSVARTASGRPVTPGAVLGVQLTPLLDGAGRHLGDTTCLAPRLRPVPQPHERDDVLNVARGDLAQPRPAVHHRLHRRAGATQHDRRRQEAV